MAIENRVALCVQVFSLIAPEWGMKVRPVDVSQGKNLTDQGEEHLLARIFGTYEEGARLVTEHSKLTLVDLGLCPQTKEECFALLRAWHATVSNERKFAIRA